MMIGDPTAVQIEWAVDTAEDMIDIKETTEAAIGHMEGIFKEYFSPEWSSKINTYKYNDKYNENNNNNNNKDGNNEDDMYEDDRYAWYWGRKWGRRRRDSRDED
jgi:hypothetical protein